MDAGLQFYFMLSAAVFFAAAGTLAITGSFQKERAERIQRQFERVTTGDVTDHRTPLMLRILVSFGRRMLWRGRDIRELTKLLREAGYFSSLALFEFVAAQAGLVVLFAAATGLAASRVALTSAELTLAVLAAATLAGFLPRFWLGRRAARRLRAIRREVPFLLDMLLLLLKSGAGIERCFREVAQLGTEVIPESHRTIELLISDLDQGRDYSASLDRWAARMSEPSAREVAQQMQQALAHGTEISRALTQLSERLITQRLNDGRELAGRRSTHMTVATLMFFMPPLMIILAAPGFSAVIGMLTGQK